MSLLRTVQQQVPVSAYTPYPHRMIRGGVMHHTAGLSVPLPVRGASYSRVFGQDGTVYYAVDPRHASHHVLQTDKWRPPWVVSCPDGRVSDMNYSSLAYAFVYAPQEPYNQTPTQVQYESLRWQIERDYKQYGVFPFVGHGEIDSGKWATEPHGFSWAIAGFGSKTEHGRLWMPSNGSQEQDVEVISDEDLKRYFEIYGIGVNMETALMQRASQAYRRGETRGPALSGEYEYAGTDGSTKIRQRFTAGTCEYDPTTGGLGWAEINLHPEPSV